MDRERLFRHLEQRYTSKREMISRIPLGAQTESLWQELLSRRRAKSTVLPICNAVGMPFWYVTTDKMVSASEKVVEMLLENEQDFDPYNDIKSVTIVRMEVADQSIICPGSFRFDPASWSGGSRAAS